MGVHVPAYNDDARHKNEVMKRNVIIIIMALSSEQTIGTNKTSDGILDGAAVDCMAGVVDFDILLDLVERCSSAESAGARLVSATGLAVLGAGFLD